MISVCMATYNGERFIEKQIRSILEQLAFGDELVISDDDSTDKTREIVEQIGDPRIRLIPHKPCGVVYNFENALKAARGDYVFLSDQDDIWYEGRIQSVVSSLAAGAMVVTVDARMIDAQGVVLKESFFAANHSSAGFLKNVWKNSFLGCCMAFRRELLDYVLPFPSHLYMHDWWIGLVASFLRFRCEFLPVPYHGYRKHGSNVTDSGNTSRNPYWVRIYNRLTLLLPLLVRWGQGRLRKKG